MYTRGEYLEQNPTWHAEDSPWKASHIKKIVDRNRINPRTICEVGCGAGEILRELQYSFMDDRQFVGYEISPQAYALCEPKTNEHLRFILGDMTVDEDAFGYDLILAIDVLEHLEDYYGFLRSLKSRGEFKIFHIPLDLSVQSVLRMGPLMRRRARLGHVHLFTKDWALQALRDSGYDILDYFYTAESVELNPKSALSWIMRLPRKMLSSAHQDFSARLLGGYSLMILAR
jgi:hypothetical protein